MSSYDEISEILSSKNIVDSLSQEEKLSVSKFVHEKFPLSLELMSCYDAEIASVDVDDWNKARGQLTNFFLQGLSSEKYYLFIKAYPKNFMLYINQRDLVNVMFADEFCYPFAVFAKGFKGFLMEDKSGVIVSSGELVKAVELCK